MTSRLRLRPRPVAADQAAPARCIRRSRAGDARLWAGLGLVLVSMIGGAALLSRSDDTVVVWQATQDLAVGAPAVAVPVQVALGDASDAYLPASAPLDGTVLAAVPAGSLIPRDALGSAVPADTRFVTVAVDPLHAPVGLAAGQVVDVWTTPADAVGTAAAVPTQVIADALVAEVSFDSVGIGGQVPVVLQVVADQAEALVAATRSGVIDLVAVPLTSQQRAPIENAVEPVDAVGAVDVESVPSDATPTGEPASVDETRLTDDGLTDDTAADDMATDDAATDDTAATDATPTSQQSKRPKTTTSNAGAPKRIGTPKPKPTPTPTSTPDDDVLVMP